MLSSIFTSAEKYTRNANTSTEVLTSRKRSRKNTRDSDGEDDDKDRVGEDEDDGLTKTELSRMRLNRGKGEGEGEGNATAVTTQKRKERKPKKSPEEIAAAEEEERAAKDAEEAAALEAMNSEERATREKEERTVFVGNMSIGATQKDIMQFFRKFGLVESVRLRSVPLEGSKVDDAGNQDLVKRVSANKGKIGDQKQSQNAYVVFEKQGSVEKAINGANGALFMTRHMRVDAAASPALFDHSTTVFLGGLSKFCDEERLREFFAKQLPNGQADITGIRLIRDAETLYGKGFGYLSLKDRDGVMAALKLHGKVFKKREIRVTTCGKRTKRQAKVRTRRSGNDGSSSSSSNERKEGDGDEADQRDGEDEGDQGPRKKHRNQDLVDSNKILSPTAVAAARRLKAKAQKRIANAKRQKQLGLNKNLKTGRKLGGVIKKALKATSGKTGKGGLNKGTKSEARFKPTKKKTRG